MSRLLSGMRPTGKMHLGHYFGVLKNWVYLQDKYQSFFMIADLHALTDCPKFENLNPIIEDIVITWLSAGIDPSKATIFRQSDIKEHCELETLLSMIAKISDLKRIPSYKEADKKIKNKTGFFLYSLLQAADILLYKASVVPVGEDQVPHIEYARVLAKIINKIAEKEILPLPQPLLTKAKRVPGIDGKAKMSKSLNNVIEIEKTNFDSLWQIFPKLQTDPKRITKNDPGNPKDCPIIFPYAQLVMDANELKEIKYNCQNAKWGCLDCKKKVAEKISSFFEPIREKQKVLRKKKGLYIEILQKGKKEAQKEAQNTISLIKPIFGL